jgi:type I restriction enzyme, S subunit
MSKKKQKSIEELLEEALVPEEEQPYKVPENWVWVRLKHLVDFFSGSAFPNQYQGYNDLEIPFYKVGNLKDTDSNYYIYSEENTISEEIRVKLKAKKVPKDTILFAKIGEAIRLNRRGLVPKPACIDNNLMGFKANENILDNKLLLYWSLKEDFYKYSQATAVPSIRKSTLEAIAFPLPPIHEQKRIVEKVERLFGKIDEAKRLIEEVKESFELRRAAILDKAFKGQLGTNDPNEKSMLETSNDIKEKDLIPKEEQPYEVPENWVWVRSSHVAKWGSGGTPSRKKVEYYGGDIPWIKTGELNDGIVNTSEETITEEGLQNSSAKIFPKGSIVIAMYGATIGKLGILGIDAATNQACAVGQPHDFLNSKYMFYYFLARRSDLIALGKGGAQPNISQTIIKDFPFALPPLNEQKRIAEKVDNLLSKLETEKDMVLEVEEKFDLLKQSILNKAFRGELGTNDPTDEHAIELLKEVLKSKSK